MNKQLKPCPFCGCEMNFYRVLSGWNKITGMHGDNCPLDGNDFITWSSTEYAPIIQKFNTRADGWISVEVSLPELHFERQEDPDEDGYPQFDGMVSQTIEITDGEGFGRGHLRSDGKWICYGAEYDMMIVDPEKVTHWAQLRQLPKAASCGE